MSCQPLRITYVLFMTKLELLVTLYVGPFKLCSLLVWDARSVSRYTYNSSQTL